MLRSLIIGGLLVALSAGAALGGSPQRWLHIRVEGDDETVRVNLPFQLIEAVLPLIDVDDFERGRVRIDIDEFDVDDIDFPALIDALRESEEGEYVTVESHDENVRVTKQGEHLLINIEDGRERVEVRVRLAVVDALFSGEPDELDILAAVQALGDEEECDLVTVHGDDETVRIWVDRSNTGD
ncbi:MAG: hypothetical protein KAY32_05610 [Candidatus Eisenbacteria sp.]|nr:hypothetical protein [Candidatus Eisenbacteria bacterium]